MKLIGRPLGEWDVRIYRGVTTGLNEAFIIDGGTRDRLIAEDPRSEEILKPVLRGRDIRRFKATWARLYLIATHNGYDGIPPVDPDEYPAVKRHLQGYQPRLANRHDQGRTPYNLRHCAYHAEFAKEKLFWMHMSPEGRFAYSDTEMFSNAKAYIITGNHLKYLCAVLNSRLVTWLVGHMAVTTGMGLPQWNKFVVVDIPVPNDVPPAQHRRIEHLIDKILKSKVENPTADTSHWELGMDRIVCELYGLTPQEVEAVETDS